MVSCSACGKSFEQEAGHGCGDSPIAAELRGQVADLRKQLQAFETLKKGPKIREKKQEERGESKPIIWDKPIPPPPDVRKCNKPGHPHFDVRFGCPACPRGEALFKIQVANLEQSVRDWKEAWFHNRDIIGEVTYKAWLRDHPMPPMPKRRVLQNTPDGQIPTIRIEEPFCVQAGSPEWEEAYSAWLKGSPSPTKDPAWKAGVFLIWETVGHACARCRYSGMSGSK